MDLPCPFEPRDLLPPVLIRISLATCLWLLPGFVTAMESQLDADAEVIRQAAITVEL